MPAEETKRVQAKVGPYAGQHLDLPADEAAKAIEEGWAMDPFEPVDPDAEPEEFDQDKHDKTIEAAEAAARRLRGEEDPKPAKGKGKADADEAEETTRKTAGRPKSTR